MRKALIPWDIRNECLWIVRGYRRRLRAYNEARSEIMSNGGGNYQTVSDPDNPGETMRVFSTGSGGTSRVTESKAMRLAALEELEETKRMRAVEKARLNIGADVINMDSRMRLVDAIVISCEDGKKSPYRMLNVDEFSERDFYRRRDRFLIDIAKFLGMM